MEESHILVLRGIRSFQQWYASTRELIDAHRNVTLIGTDIFAITVIRVAEHLQRNNVARKINVNVGFWRDFPQITIRMSTREEPQPLVAEKKTMDRVIFVERGTHLHEAYLALIPAKRVMLVACDSVILKLIGIVTSLQDLNVGRKISISTSSNEPRGHTRMVVVMQGIQTSDEPEPNMSVFAAPQWPAWPRSCSAIGILPRKGRIDAWPEVGQVAQLPFLPLPQQVEASASRRLST